MADLLARANKKVSSGLEDSTHGSSERQIVVAIDTTDDSLRALKWAINELYRSGDAFHIVHVAKVVEEESEIYHGAVGTSFHYHEKSLAAVDAEIAKVKTFLADKVVAELKEAGIPHFTHLYVEGTKAPASAVVDIIEKVAKAEKADLVVLSRSNKTWWERFNVGSVALGVSRLPFPVVLVTTPAEHQTEPAEEGAPTDTAPSDAA